MVKTTKVKHKVLQKKNFAWRRNGSLRSNYSSYGVGICRISAIASFFNKRTTGVCVNLISEWKCLFFLIDCGMFRLNINPMKIQHDRNSFLLQNRYAWIKFQYHVIVAIAWFSGNVCYLHIFNKNIVLKDMAIEDMRFSKFRLNFK